MTGIKSRDVLLNHFESYIDIKKISIGFRKKLWGKNSANSCAFSIVKKKDRRLNEQRSNTRFPVAKNTISDVPRLLKVRCWEIDSRFVTSMRYLNLINLKKYWKISFVKSLRQNIWQNHLYLKVYVSLLSQAFLKLL